MPQVGTSYPHGHDLQRAARDKLAAYPLQLAAQSGGSAGGKLSLSCDRPNIQGQHSQLSMKGANKTMGEEWSNNACRGYVIKAMENWSDTIKPHTQGAIIIRERVLQMGQKYNAEYKADVLKMAEEIGVSAACRQLGISSKTVYNWRRAERIAKGEIRGVQPGETPEQAVVRLTREIRELQEANYILRKALGFMAGR